MRPDQISFYPPYRDVVNATAAHFGVEPACVALTNGLDEGIFAVAVTFLRTLADGALPEAIVPQPAFEIFELNASVAGGRTVHVMPRPDFAFALDEVLQAITPRTRAVFLTNPNNPTGVSMPLDAITTVARQVPDGAVVFVDEAYADFAGATFIPELSACRNVIVGRTFAKAHGLAGLRIGALVGMSDTLAPVRQAIGVYSVNIAAVVALQAALQDGPYVARYLAQVRESKALVYAACDRLGLKYWKSDANFVLVRTGGRTDALTGAAAERGIYLRDRGSEPGCEGCIRITAGLVAAHTGGAGRSRRGLMRRALIDRRTTETQISLALTIEGKGRYQVATGIRFLDHMLELFSRHGGFDLRIKATGDLDVDQHHTVEDLGIALGEAVSRALGNRRGINRAGYFVMPMDETLAVVALDLGGRPHTVVELTKVAAAIGDLQTELVHDFFEGFAVGARANVHVKVLYGRSSHHKVEAVFKAFARALRVACAKDKQLARMLPSTKGLL